MRKRSTYLSITLAIITILPALAQFPNATQRRSPNFNFEANLASNNIMRSRDVLQEVLNQGKNNEIAVADVEGDPYFQEIFSNGSMMYKDSLNLGMYLMRYNAFADEIEVSNPDGINVINKADYISVILDGDKFVPLNYEVDNGNIEKGFFIEKAKGTHTNLFLRRYKTVKQGQEAKTSFHKSTPPVFVNHEAYYIKFGVEAPKEVKLKKSKFLGSFPMHSEKLKSYTKKQNLNLETEGGAIKLVEYYNTLN